MRIRKTTAALLLTYFLGLAIAVLGPDILAARYYYDAATILERLLNSEDFAFGDPFGNTAMVYAWLGFGRWLPHTAAGPLSYTVCYWLLIYSTGLATSRWRPLLFLWLAAWNIPMAIYLGTYSKEFIAFLIVGVLLFLSRSFRGICIGIALASLYAAFFRTYWAIIIVLFIGLTGGWRLGWSWTARLTLVAGLVIAMSLAANEFAGMWLSDGRTIANVGREGDPDSVTMFSNPLENRSVLTDLANIGFGWLWLLLPVYLLMLGATQHVAFGLFQLANTVLFVWVASALPGPRTSSTEHNDAQRLAVAASWCIAYSFVQGMFEPDFGSYARHEITSLPMFFYLLCNAPRAFPLSTRRLFVTGKTR